MDKMEGLEVVAFEGDPISPLVGVVTVPMDPSIGRGILPEGTVVSLSPLGDLLMELVRCRFVVDF